MDHSDLTEPPRGGKRRAAPVEVSVAPPSPTPRPRREAVVAVTHVPPLDADGVRSVGVITALWALALVALLPFYGWLDETGRVWWVWTCSAGLGLGLIGLDICLKRRAKAQTELRGRLAETSGGRRRR